MSLGSSSQVKLRRITLNYHPFHVTIKCATEPSRSWKQLKSLFTSCALTLGAWFSPCREAGPLYSVIAQTLIMSFSSHFNFHLVKWFSDDEDSLHVIERAHILVEVYSAAFSAVFTFLYLSSYRPC